MIIIIQSIAISYTETIILLLHKGLYNNRPPPANNIYKDLILQKILMQLKRFI